MRKALILLLVLLAAASVFGARSPPIVERVSAQADHVVINEFQAKGAEWIELYNPTTSAVNTVGWKIGDGESNETLDGDWGVTSIPAGGYVVHFTTLGLSNSYDEIFLWDASGNLVDDVYYGCSNGNRDKGGCPVGGNGSDGRSSARAPNGHDTDDYARDFALVATPGGPNVAPAPNLGGEGVIINEFLHRNPDGSNNRSVELYNIGTTTVNLTYWWLTDDSDGYYNITTPTVIAPGGFQIITTGLWPDGDILSLFTSTGVRADQLAIESSAPPANGESYQRGPLDGQGPNDGYDFASSGDPDHLTVDVETLNSTNFPSWDFSVEITLEDMTVAATSSWTWNVSVEDNYGNPLPGVTLTASYAPYGTTTYTTLPGTPIDHGDGNYTFTHDISTLKGAYHLKVEGTKAGYDPGSATSVLNVIGSETIVVLWDGAHDQYSGHLGTLVDGTWDVWRSFPDCIVKVNDQPFTTSLLSDADILIIPYIQTPLTSTEMAALDGFLQDGGMVWWGGYYHMSHFNHTMNNEWIKNYGFRFLNGTQIFDNRINIRDPTDNTGQPYYPVFHTFPNEHPLLTGITELAISGTTQVYVDPASTNTTILATGDSVDTYWDADGSGTNNAGDINGTDAVPLAVYETGTGGALIVCGGSNMLYEFDLDVGKSQFWRNMYDYRIRTRTGITFSLSSTSFSVNRTESVQFTLTVTVESVGTKTLRNVRIWLSFPHQLTLPGGAIPTCLGNLSPGSDASVSFTFWATENGNFTITVTITADAIQPLTEQVDVHAFTSTPPPPPPPPPTPLPGPLNPFILGAVIGTIVVVVVAVIFVLFKRRKP